MILEAIASELPVLPSDQPPFIKHLGREQAVWVNPKEPSHSIQKIVLGPSTSRLSCFPGATSILDQYSWHH